MAIRNYILLLILSILITSCASVGPGGEEGNYPQDSSAQLGTRYLLGRGVAPNDAKAFYYFSQAANQGDAMAQNELAFLYAAGRGTAKDPAKAQYWYEKAGQQGLASAQYNLGLMRYYGVGSAANHSQGRALIQEAAQKGFEPAKQTLTTLS